MHPDPRTPACPARRADRLVLARAQKGQILRVDVPPVGAPLAVELYRAALAAGGASVRERRARAAAGDAARRRGSDEQLEVLSPIATAEVEFVDAIVTIWSESNTRALSRAAGAPPAPDRVARASWPSGAGSGSSAGELRWCGVVFPTARARAGRARCRSTSTSASSSAPATWRAPRIRSAHWNGVRARSCAAARMRSARRASSASSGPDTDLQLGVEGRTWQPRTAATTCPTARSTRARSRP